MVGGAGLGAGWLAAGALVVLRSAIEIEAARATMQ
jgi:hypothetical protein